MQCDADVAPGMPRLDADFDLEVTPSLLLLQGDQSAFAPKAEKSSSATMLT